MRKKIRLLDLCCKAGGCSVGYKRAADELGIEIEITGIDIEEQKNYPFRFLKRDAVPYLQKYGHKYNFFHASPPCQKYSVACVPFFNVKEYRDNLLPILESLEKTGNPGVVENVMPAPIRPDIVLRGDMFGLKVLRARKFQLINCFMLKTSLPKKRGSVKNGDFAQVLGNGQLKVTNGKRFKIPGDTVHEVWSNAMGIDWMNREEIREAIPQAYTHYIGLQLFQNFL